MKKYSASFILFLFLASCSTSNIFTTTKVGEEPEEYLEKKMYVLPQTLFQVSIEYEKETFIPGPYRLFTEKFLGMTEYIKEPSLNYRIVNVDLQSFTEPDPEHFYNINILEGSLDWYSFFEMTRFGLILDPSGIYEKDYSSRISGELPEIPYFSNLSVKNNLQEITDTLYKTIISDSSYVRIPVVRKQMEAKTLEQKAEEAANFIIKIRKRRFKLLAGQYEIFPEGKALAISVEELDKLEKEYLELFFGKTIKQQFRQRFIITPASSTTQQDIPVARFSPLYGLKDLESNLGNEIFLRIEPTGKLKYIASDLEKNDPLEDSNIILYRVPEIATISLRILDDILYQGRVSVYQSGELAGIKISEK